MSIAIKADVNDLAEYINRMNSILNDLFEKQTEVNRAYNKATTEWCDQISRDTGEALDFAGKKIEDLNGYFMNLLYKLNQGFSHMTEYYLAKSWDAQLQNYDLECYPIITEVISTRISGTTAASIRAFETALDSYIESTENCIKNTRSALNDVGYWADDYFNTTKEKTEEFSKEMTECMSYLSEELEWIRKKRISFEEAQEKFDQ